MKLKALRALRYASKSVLKGAVFDAKDGDVRVLVGAKIAEHYVEPAPRKDHPAAKRIVTHFLENSEPTFVADPGKVEAEADAVVAKRSYKRRDMTAE